jgi:predicted nucleic acid-binding Zn ribbon protein
MVTAAFPLRQHPEWVRGPAHLEGDEVVLREGAAERYLTDESEHRLQLLMDLTSLRDCKPQDVVRFVNRHGLLWHGPKDVGSGKCRESLADWRGEVSHLWLTISFYLILKLAQEIGTARPVRNYLQRLRDPDLDFFYARIPDDDRECLETVSLLLAERITRGMEGCSWTLVAACTLSRDGVREGGPMDFLFGEDPPNLVAAAYAQLAHLLVNKVPVNTCGGCGIMFIPKRAGQKYCSQRCSNRLRKARQRAKEN